MPTKTIELSREAGRLREEAHKKFEELKNALAEQKAKEDAGEEIETRLSTNEIAERRAEIERLLEQAKELSGMSSLEDIMTRPAEELSHGAREVLNEATQSGVSQAGGVVPPHTSADPVLDAERRAFPTLGTWLKSIRALAGEYSDYEPTRAQVRMIEIQRKQAHEFMRGDRWRNVKQLGNKDLADDWDKKLLTGAAGSADSLVPQVHLTDLLRAMFDTSDFVGLARQVPMQRRQVTFPRLKQDDATVSRPMFGFAAVSKVAEGAQKPEREPQFEQFVLTAVKYAAYVEAADELLEESIVPMPPLLTEMLTLGIMYEYDRDAMRGSGVGEPAGWIGHASEFPVNRTTANQINLADIYAMESRFFGSDGVYIFSQSVIPQLFSLTEQNIVAWNSDLTAGVPGTLLGRRMIRTHKLPLLGNKGDLNLVDPSFYLAGNLQAVTIASSRDFKFRDDVTAWRAIFRAAGSPWPAAPFSAEASGGAFTFRVSPFVVLDVVASS